MLSSLARSGLFALALTSIALSQTVTWSAEPVQIESAGSSWTRMAQLQDGSWLAAYMIGPSPTGLRVKRSFDDMRTWVWLADIRETGRDLDNANLYERPDGVVLLAMRSLVSGASYRINIYQSADSGNSWQFASTVDRNEGGKPGGLWEPFLLGLANGRIACFYANETHSNDNPAYSQIISERISDDGGATWGPETYAVAQPGAARPGEPNVAQLENGFLLFYEVCGTENCVGHTSSSGDGVAWPGSIGPAIPDTWQDAQGLSTSTGLLFAVSNGLDILISGNSGEAWVDTGVRPFAVGTWPALYQTGRNEIALVMTGAGVNGQPGEYVRFGQIAGAAFQPRPGSQLPIARPVIIRGSDSGR